MHRIVGFLPAAHRHPGHLLSIGMYSEILGMNHKTWVLVLVWEQLSSFAVLHHVHGATSTSHLFWGAAVTVQSAWLRQVCIVQDTLSCLAALVMLALWCWHVHNGMNLSIILLHSFRSLLPLSLLNYTFAFLALSITLCRMAACSSSSWDWDYHVICYPLQYFWRSHSFSVETPRWLS